MPAVVLPVPRGVEPDFLPATIDVSGDIANNEVRDHLRAPVGSGIRVGALGLFAWDVPSTSHYTIHDNLLVNNRFAMTVDAAFPMTGALLKGDMDVSFSGNVMQQSCQTNLLVAFTRHTTALGLQQDAYLLNSTYRLQLGGNIQWKDVWYSHPGGFGNTLVVDGSPIANGTRQFYDPERCPGRQAPLASGSPGSQLNPGGPCRRQSPVERTHRGSRRFSTRNWNRPIGAADVRVRSARHHRPQH